MFLRCGNFTLALDRPLIMGVVNVTPDSFSDGGRYASRDAASTHARALIAEGADIVDIGGESTRPGAAGVSLDDERRRVLPVLEALNGCGVPISVDTRKPELMREAIAAGASMVNDISALEAPGALEAIAGSGAAVCLMHKQGEPQTMQQAPHYDDVVREVRDYLAERVAAAVSAGIARERIVIDPGFGFGKSFEHNLALLRELAAFTAFGVPVLAGLSRKAMLGRITGRDAHERVYASVAAALFAAEQGARILRVHDVTATRDALAVWWALSGRMPNPLFIAQGRLAKKAMKRKYFGTDGVRGKVGDAPITPEFVMRLGYAAGKVLAGRHASAEHPTVLIGKDTRVSGYMLESALQAGLSAAGVDVVLVGPMPTPAVAYLTRALRLSAGIVISASHNPYRGQRHQVLFGRRREAARRDRKRDRARARRAARVREIGQPRQGAPHGRRGRALHRVLQEHVSRRARPEGHAHRRRLRARRRVPDRAVRVSRARRRCGFDRREPDGFNINDGVGATASRKRCRPK